MAVGDNTCCRSWYPFAFTLHTPLVVALFQHENSNKSQVTLRDVDFALSGMFSCEVTADAPTFTTAYVSKNLTVVCKYMLHDITEYRGKLDVFSMLVCLPYDARCSPPSTPFFTNARDWRVYSIVSHHPLPSYRLFHVFCAEFQIFHRILFNRFSTRHFFASYWYFFLFEWGTRIFKRFFFFIWLNILWVNFNS